MNQHDTFFNAYTIQICIRKMNTFRNCKVMAISIRDLFLTHWAWCGNIPNLTDINIKGFQHLISNHSRIQLQLRKFNSKEQQNIHTKFHIIPLICMWPKVTPSNVWNSANVLSLLHMEKCVKLIQSTPGFFQNQSCKKTVFWYH